MTTIIASTHSNENFIKTYQRVQVVDVKTQGLPKFGGQTRIVVVRASKGNNLTLRYPVYHAPRVSKGSVYQTSIKHGRIWLSPVKEKPSASRRGHPAGWYL